MSFFLSLAKKSTRKKVLLQPNSFSMELIDFNEIRAMISGRVIRAFAFAILIIFNSLLSSSAYILRGHYHLNTDIDSITDAQQEDLKWVRIL